MSFANSPKRTYRPLAMTLPVLLPDRNQSRASRCPRVRRIGMRTPVYPTLRLPAQRSGRCLVLRPADDRLSHGCSRPADEVGQVVLHGSLGEDQETPVARTPAVRVLSRARYRHGGRNLRSRRPPSRRRQQILAWPFPVALRAGQCYPGPFPGSQDRC